MHCLLYLLCISVTCERQEQGILPKTNLINACLIVPSVPLYHHLVSMPLFLSVLPERLKMVQMVHRTIRPFCKNLTITLIVTYRVYKCILALLLYCMHCIYTLKQHKCNKCKVQIVMKEMSIVSIAVLCQIVANLSV